MGVLEHTKAVLMALAEKNPGGILIRDIDGMFLKTAG